MSNLKIGSKITLGYITLIAISVIMVGFLTSRLFSINQNARILAQDTMPMVNDSAGLERTLLTMAMELRSYGLTEEKNYLQTGQSLLPQVESRLNAIDANLSDYQSPDGQELKQTAAKIRMQLEEIEALLSALENTMNKLTKARADFSRLRDQVFTDHLYPFFGLIQDELAAGHGDDQETKDRLNRYTTLSNSMWDNYEATNLTFWQGQARRSPQEISGAAELLKKSVSDLNELLAETALPPEVQTSGQELAGQIPQIQAVLDDFIILWKERSDNEAKTSELLRAISQNLNALGTKAGETGAKGADQTGRNAASALTASFAGLALTLIAGLLCAVFISRGITGSIKAAISQISSGADDVDRNAGILAGAANVLSEGASRTASSLEDIASALEELSAMTSRNSLNAAQADSLMKGARDDVTQAGLSMDKAVKAMGEISASGQEISNIIKTIDEIAFQTNLLALNAAVEAARAGEAGSGFAVVADEVRNLAIRSAEAAKNTAGLIDETIKNIMSGSELVRQTGDSFQRVDHSVTQVGNILSEVAEASLEQAQGIAQINRSMSEMDMVTKDNLRASNQAAGASSDLAGQSEDLLDTVNQLSAMVYKR